MRAAGVNALAASHGHESVTDAVRSVLARLRREITSGLLDVKALQLALSGLTGAIENQLRNALRFSLRPALAASGMCMWTDCLGDCLRTKQELPSFTRLDGQEHPSPHKQPPRLSWSTTMRRRCCWR